MTSARLEWVGIGRLRALGVPTLNVVGRGIRGNAPAHEESFVVTEALEGMISLEQLTQNWGELPARQRLALKRELIRQVATIARTIHCNGLNHRDFYLCHFLVKDRDWNTWQTDESLVLHVIDLHRMQHRPSVPNRWWVKDVVGVLFSALDCDLTSNDLLLFSKIYWDCPARELIGEKRGVLQKIYQKARKLYASIHDREAPDPVGNG